MKKLKKILFSLFIAFAFVGILGISLNSAPAKASGETQYSITIYDNNTQTVLQSISTNFGAYSTEPTLTKVSSALYSYTYSHCEYAQQDGAGNYVASGYEFDWAHTTSSSATYNFVLVAIFDREYIGTETYLLSVVGLDCPETEHQILTSTFNLTSGTSLTSILTENGTWTNSRAEITNFTYAKTTDNYRKGDICNLTTMPEYDVYLQCNYEMITQEYTVSFYYHENNIDSEYTCDYYTINGGNSGLYTFTVSGLDYNTMISDSIFIIDDYKFVGWYLVAYDKDGNMIPGDIMFTETSIVNTNLDLIAKYRSTDEKLQIVIQGYYEDGSNLVALISEDDVISLPQEPFVPAGKEWDGKYYIAGTNTEFKQNVMGQTDIVLCMNFNNKSLKDVVNEKEELTILDKIDSFVEENKVAIIVIILLVVGGAVTLFLINNKPYKRYRRR